MKPEVQQIRDNNPELFNLVFKSIRDGDDLVSKTADMLASLVAVGGIRYNEQDRPLALEQVDMTNSLFRQMQIHGVDREIYIPVINPAMRNAGDLPRTGTGSSARTTICPNGLVLAGCSVTHVLKADLQFTWVRYTGGIESRSLNLVDIDIIKLARSSTTYRDSPFMMLRRPISNRAAIGQSELASAIGESENGVVFRMVNTPVNSSGVLLGGEEVRSSVHVSRVIVSPGRYQNHLLLGMRWTRDYSNYLEYNGVDLDRALSMCGATGNPTLVFMNNMHYRAIKPHLSGQYTVMCVNGDNPSDVSDSSEGDIPSNIAAY